MLFCLIQVAPFANENMIHFITTAKHAVMVESIKYLGKYMSIYLILSCEKETTYILIFYINKFQRKLFTKF